MPVEMKVGNTQVLENQITHAQEQVLFYDHISPSSIKLIPAHFGLEKDSIDPRKLIFQAWRIATIERPAMLKMIQEGE